MMIIDINMYFNLQEIKREGRAPLDMENYFYFFSPWRVTGGAPPADGALGDPLYHICLELALSSSLYL